MGDFLLSEEQARQIDYVNYIIYSERKQDANREIEKEIQQMLETSSKQMARLRTLDSAMAELKALDPNTNVSKNFVRQLALSGKIRVVFAGNRRMIDMDSLIDYLSNSTFEEAPEKTGTIRRVD